jgi:signal transduction histidine kinase
MADKERKFLKGHLGVGPLNYEEAWQIWDEVDRSNFSLAELSKHFYKSKISSERAKFQAILEKLTTPLNDENHIFNISLKERRPILVEHAFNNPQIDERVKSALGVEHFLVMPLISRNRSIGILLTDNFVTNNPITPRDMQTLQTFAFPVAFAIERASLYESLQEEIENLSEANIKLLEQQELIVRMEKMAVIGRVTSSIAHSIRNPLTAIGGHARSLLKNPDNLERRKESLEFIVSEAKHLDEVLEDVLNYSDSIHPVMDFWDINQLVISVISEIERKWGEGIRIEINLDSDLPPTKLDYKQISFCLKTVMNHIAQKQPEVKQIEVKTFRSADMLVISVSDNGAPLPREIKESLINPFNTTEELGIGVGLPLCKVILERHGNSFEIEEPPEGGNRYCIKLPLSTEEAHS